MTEYEWKRVIGVTLVALLCGVVMTVLAAYRLQNFSAKKRNTMIAWLWGILAVFTVFGICIYIIWPDLGESFENGMTAMCQNVSDFLGADLDCR